jgi:hypothetical protein
MGVATIRHGVQHLECSDIIVLAFRNYSLRRWPLFFEEPLGCHFSALLRATIFGNERKVRFQFSFISERIRRGGAVSARPPKNHCENGLASSPIRLKGWPGKTSSPAK